MSADELSTSSVLLALDRLGVRVPSGGMSFNPRGVRGASPGLPGEIDYRLARQAVISEFRKGRVAQHEVCDAHPELLRAARNVGEESSRACPICEVANVVLVSYVFGPRMPAHGRCVTTKAELQGLASRGEELACYVVEVCPACSWNHLARTFLLTPAPARRPPSSNRSAPSA
jgi:hypothetical protein